MAHIILAADVAEVLEALLFQSLGLCSKPIRTITKQVMAAYICFFFNIIVVVVFRFRQIRDEYLEHGQICFNLPMPSGNS